MLDLASSILIIVLAFTISWGILTLLDDRRWILRFNELAVKDCRNELTPEEQEEFQYMLIGGSHG